jgi:hypothetical protein
LPDPIALLATVRQAEQLEAWLDGRFSQSCSRSSP